ncbi:MAG: tetratricopeptide repeat protein [Clostridium sp.]
MDYRSLFKEKLGKLLFIEVEKEGFKKMVQIPEYIEFEEEELFLPISSEYLTENIGDKLKIKNIPIYYIIEGILLTLGADKDIKFKNDYIKLIRQIPEAEECGKSLVFKKINSNELVDGYLILKGLSLIFDDEEYIKKLLLIGVSIREENRDFEDILLEDIEKAKKEFEKLNEPYLYRSVIYKDLGDYQGARVEVNEYLIRGGVQTPEIELLMKDIENITSYEEAIELLDKDTEKSIGILLDLVEKFDGNPLMYYYLGVGYRKIGKNEKAIEYLLESLRIDSGILEVVNEIGINYACLGDYEEGSKYLRKAFEASKEVGICTNLIMCYINLGKIEDAKLHLEIAEKLDKDDEIVIKIRKFLEKK